MTTANDMLSRWQTLPQAAALFLRYWRKTLSSLHSALSLPPSNTCLLHKGSARCQWDKLWIPLRCSAQHFRICSGHAKVLTHNATLIHCNDQKNLQTTLKGQSFIFLVGKLVMTFYSVKGNMLRYSNPPSQTFSLPSILAFFTRGHPVYVLNILCVCTGDRMEWERGWEVTWQGTHLYVWSTLCSM